MISLLLYSETSEIYGLGNVGYGYYGFDWTYILVIIGGLISLIASANVKGTFDKFAKRSAMCGLTGADVARRILDSEGIYNMPINRVSGNLTDYYDPRSKTLNLSDSVCQRTSVAAIAVAAHECGHAIQHNEGYELLTIRNKFVPVANFGSKAGVPIIFLGILLAIDPLAKLGIILFSCAFLFQLLTLPVELDASRRALAKLEGLGLVYSDEQTGARKVLKAAALTYVAALAASMLSLLRLILIVNNGRRRR